MSMLMHINWDNEKAESWRKTRAKGKRHYVIKEGFALLLPYLAGILFFAFILGSSQGRINDSSFWIWLSGFLLIGLLSAFNTSSWKWNETESSYNKYLHEMTDKGEYE